MSGTSIYGMLGQGVTPLQQPSPLDTYGRIAGVGNLLMQGQALKSKQAAGRAFQASINPDGSTNQAALMQNLAADPTAAMSAQESAQAGQTLSTAEYGQQMARMANGTASAAQLLASNPNGVPYNVLKQHFDGLVADGTWTQADEQRQLAGFGQDPAANAEVIKSRIGQAVGAQQALHNAVGTPMVADTGNGPIGVVQGGMTSGSPGAIATVGGAVPQTLSNAQQNETVTIQDPTPGAPVGQMKTYTRAQLAQMGLPMAGLPRTGGTPGPLGTGRPLPPSLLNPNKSTLGSIGAGSPGYAPAASATADPAAATTPTVAAPLPVGLVSSVGPAQTAAASATGAASAGAFKGISDQGVEARSQNAILGNMLGDAHNFTSGQPDANAVKATIQKYAPSLAASLGVKPESVAANESFDKLANQIATAQGADSDARLSVRQHGNPNSTLSQEGVDGILRQLQGNADYKAARATLASHYPDQSDIRGFEEKQGSKLDPRAFQFDRMTPEQRVVYAKSLSPTDQKAVQKAYVTAGQMGLLSSGWTPNGQ